MAKRQPIAVVTGVSGGLGPAVVAALTNASFQVAGISHAQADVTHEGQVEAAIGRIVGQHGSIEALVNVAGGFAGGKHVQETDEATWDYMLALNLKSAFLCCKAVVPHMLAANYGRIVNVSSRAAVQPGAGLSAYNVSKMGVITLTQTLAAELRGHNITANVVVPSVIDTPSNRQAMPKADYAKWVTPEAIAAVIADLVSDRWAIVSGATIPVYGDA